MEQRFRRLLQAGDEMQRCFWAQLGRGRIPRPSDAMELTLGMLGASAQAMSVFLPRGPQEASLLEFQNKVHALEWFAYVDSRAGLDGRASLADWLQLVQALNLDDRAWAAEGLGYHAARRAWLGGELQGRLQAELPQWSLIVLHTGMGMFLAERILEQVVSNGQLLEALGRFCSLCLANSKPGYEGCAVEQLGLVARTLHPRKIPEIDRILHENSPDLREYLWHGVGRALYFSPANFLPWGNSGRRAIDMAQDEAGDEGARKNAVAGASWAFTLVNLRTPEVMERFLKEHGANLLAEPAFVDGVRSALTIWRELQPEDPALPKLLTVAPPELAPPENGTAAFGAVFRFRGLATEHAAS
jgi:hypothetical protein